jgi:hypothetical protein
LKSPRGSWSEERKGWGRLESSRKQPSSEEALLLVKQQPLVHVGAAGCHAGLSRARGIYTWQMLPSRALAFVKFPSAREPVVKICQHATDSDCFCMGMGGCICQFREHSRQTGSLRFYVKFLQSSSGS